MKFMFRSWLVTLHRATTSRRLRLQTAPVINAQIRLQAAFRLAPASLGLQSCYALFWLGPLIRVAFVGGPSTYPSWAMAVVPLLCNETQEAVITLLRVMFARYTQGH